MNSKADILLVTATKVESKAVLDIFLQNISGQMPQLVSVDDRTYHDLGIINKARVFLVQSEMGSGGLGASQQTVQKGISALSPNAVIMVGISYGIDSNKQSIGDVLISQQLMLYDLQRVGEKEGNLKIILRGDKPHASPRLLNYFHSADLSWDESKCKASFGLILSGEKLVDNIDFRQQLHDLCPEAIGGEMEGAGLYVACQDNKVDWILVKSICDWADGNKNENKESRQQLAAENAASYVLHILQLVNFTTKFQEFESASDQKSIRTESYRKPIIKGNRSFDADTLKYQYSGKQDFSNGLEEDLLTTKIFGSRKNMDLFYRAHLHSSKGNYVKALEICEDILKVKPDCYEVHFFKGEILSDLGMFEQAVEALDEGLEINSKDSIRWYNRGQILASELKRFDEAISSFNKAIEIFPDFYQAWACKGSALGDLGKHREALDMFDMSIKINPKDDHAWYNKGNAFANLKMYEEAIDSYEKVIGINKDNILAWYYKGRVYSYILKYEEALYAINEAIKRNPDFEDAWHLKAIIYHKTGQIIKELESINKIIDIKPQEVDGLYLKSRILFNLRRKKEALEFIERALEIKSDYFEAWDFKSIILLDLKRYNAAFEAVTNALGINSKVAKTWLLKSAILLNLGKFNEMFHSINKALELNPDFAYAYYGKSIMHFHLDQYNEALQSIQRALE